MELGHRDSRIVERYRHLSDDEAKRKMDQLQFFGKNREIKMQASEVRRDKAAQETTKINMDSGGKEPGVPAPDACHNTDEVQASIQQNEKTRDNDEQEKQVEDLSQFLSQSLRQSRSPCVGPVVKGAYERRTGRNGEAGIRTRDTSLTLYNGLANRRLQPLGHLSGKSLGLRGPELCQIRPV